MKTTSILFFLIFCFLQVASGLNHSSSNATAEEFFIIVENGKKGLKNAKGKVVIPPKYENIGWSDGTTAPVDGVIGFQKNGLWGIISVSNKIITDAEYIKLTSNAPNAAIVASTYNLEDNEQRFGVLNTKGKIIIPFNYYVLVGVGEYLIAADKSDGEAQYGIIDYSHEIVVSLTYENIYPISSALLVLHTFDGFIEVYHLEDENRVLEGLTKFELWERGLFTVYKDLKCGLIDEHGKSIIPIEYKKFKWEGDQLKGQKYSNWTVCTGAYRKINEVDCDDIVFNEANAILIGLKNKVVADQNGNPFTPGFFEDIDNVVGRQVVFREGVKYGIYDGVKQQVVKRNIDSLWLEGEFFYAMMINEGKRIWSIIDTFQIKRNKFDYDIVKPQHNRMFAVNRSGYWGFMVRNGYEIIQCKYDSVGDFVVNDVLAKTGDEEGILSISGRWSVKLRKSKIELLTPLYFLNREKGKTTLEKINGEMVYSTDNPIEYINGLLWEYRNDGTTIKINLQGEIISAPYNFSGSEYEDTKYIYDEWIAIKKKGKYGYFDTKMGILRIANRYEDVGSANNGPLITVKILGKWGAVNRSEDLIIQPNYDSIYSFVEGMSITKINDQYGLINDKGDVILSNRYEQIMRQKNGRYVTKENNKFGLIDKEGKVIITHKYDSLQDTSNGYAIIRTGEKFGVVTLNGLNTVPQVYDNVQYNPKSNLYFAETKNAWKTISINE